MVSTTVPLIPPGTGLTPMGGAGFLLWVSSAVQQVATEKIKRVDRIMLILLFMAFLQKNDYLVAQLHGKNSIFQTEIQDLTYLQKSELRSQKVTIIA